MKVLAAILLMISSCTLNPAYAQLPKPTPKVEEKALIQCFFDKPVSAITVESKVDTYEGRQYILIALFQTQEAVQEKQPNIVMAYPFKGYGQIGPFPTIYLIDRDLNGEFDEEWDDMQGNGRCDQMKRFPIRTSKDKEM